MVVAIFIRVIFPSSLILSVAINASRRLDDHPDILLYGRDPLKRVTLLGAFDVYQA